MTELPKVLPSAKLKTKWVPLEIFPEKMRERIEYVARTHPRGFPVCTLRRRFVALDVCYDSVGRHLRFVKVALLQDHPFLRTLEKLPHVPRLVRSKYLADVRLRWERAKSVDAMSLVRPQFLWERYLQSIAEQDHDPAI